MSRAQGQGPGSEQDHETDHAPAGPVRVEDRGKVYFRSLEEIQDDPSLHEFLSKEFPAGASELADPVTRRDFLTLMGASVGLAGFGSGCIRRPESHIVPYGRRPEEVVPGLPTYYATVHEYAGQVTGLVVESHQGRPTKIEGNPAHPASMGAACSIEQAGILGVYDPDRVTSVMRAGAPDAWASFDAWLAAKLEELRGRGGQGLVVLHEKSASPTFERMAAAVRQALPQARLLEYEPIADDAVREGTRLAFGQPFEPVYRTDCDAILAVDSDFLGSGPLHLRYARDFASRRVPEEIAPDRPMSRLWIAEPRLTVTGGSADHRLRIRSSEAGPFLRVLAARLAAAGVPIPAGVAAGGDGGFPARFMTVLASDLASRRGRCLITVGRHQPAEVQAIAHALNAALGNIGATVFYGPVADPGRVSHLEAIRSVATALESGQVDTLLILGGNPAYDAPADLDLAAKLQRAKDVVVLTEGPNETSALAGWVLPRTHFLESWGDALVPDGTYSVQQPLIRPIWDGRSTIELLARLSGQQGTDGQSLVRETFDARLGGGELAWKRTLHDGVSLAGRNQFELPQLAMDGVSQAASRVPEAAEPATLQAMELVLYPDFKVYDGRFANNGWLMELPDPVTKLSWTNAALLSPMTAGALGVSNKDLVTVEHAGRRLDLPVWIQPGQADNVVAIALGYGRRVAGRVGDGRGHNAYQLRTSEAMNLGRGVRVTPAGDRGQVFVQQHHAYTEGRAIVREQTAAEYAEDPFAVRETVEHPPLVALWKEHTYTGQQWGMAIDMSRCIGCNGCMTACQAENNIPIVGPEQLHMGRWMFWIRLDRYYASRNPDDPTDMSDVDVVFQPVTCMQCENAPCENVCPVAATVHSPDYGLNDMVYNRCVGTRYCSNNCPYKVRRFNYFDWHQQNPGHREEPLTKVEQMRFNPDVTVRTRGVMEKCTYCIQRIHAGKRTSKNAGQEKVPDGAIVPACAQACPTEAIVFGDVNDAKSRVAELKKRPRNYEMLAELNTKPRTSYLAKIRNPHPEMKA